MNYVKIILFFYICLIFDDFLGVDHVTFSTPLQYSHFILNIPILHPTFQLFKVNLFLNHKATRNNRNRNIKGES